MNLVIKHHAELHASSKIEAVRQAFSLVEAIPIAIANWKEYSYVPAVTVKALYTNHSIFLCYDVQEMHISAKYREINDPVYKDSCVEFFISFDGNSYYNFEFNCIGTALVGYGTADKSTRKLLPKDLIETMTIDSVLDIKKLGASWTLLINIPLHLFNAHPIHSLKELTCSGNFYKCGDDLPMPHFVSWTPIHHPEPNFHLPQFFGELYFE